MFQFSDSILKITSNTIHFVPLNTLKKCNCFTLKIIVRFPVAEV